MMVMVELVVVVVVVVKQTQEIAGAQGCTEEDVKVTGEG